MQNFEPLINLITVLTVLSVAAERITELIKLRRENLRVRKAKEDDEKMRVYSISLTSMIVGIFLAVLAKANFFEILTSLENPWSTLGWVQVTGSTWIRAEALTNIGTFFYALAGSVITGIALGFGSKFWHDILGVVFELRDMVRTKNKVASKK